MGWGLLKDAPTLRLLTSATNTTWSGHPTPMLLKAWVWAKVDGKGLVNKTKDQHSGKSGDGQTNLFWGGTVPGNMASGPRPQEMTLPGQRARVE